jgi:hypothetical protein
MASFLSIFPLIFIFKDVDKIKQEITSIISFTGHILSFVCQG